MKNLIIVSTLILTVLTSCESKKHNKIDLRTDKDLCKIFNDTEIESLTSMIDFVDSAVVSITNNKNKAEAYHDFFKAYGLSLNTKSRIVPFQENKKYDFLENLDKGTFDAIWIFGTHINQIKYKDSILTNVDYLKFLSINPYGRYMKYLEIIGKKDERFKDIYDNIKGMGDLSTSSGLWIVHNKFDFRKVKSRIFAAIYILKIEESIDTKMDRYLK